MQENRLGHEGEGMSPLQKRAREARNRLIAAGVLPETTTTPTTPVVPTRTNRVSASSQSSFGPIPHVDSSRVRQRAQQSLQPPVAPDQPPTAPGAPPRRRVGVGGGPVLEPQRAPQLSGEIPRQAQELLKQIAREIQSIEMRINLMGRGAVGETATTRLIDLLMDLASVSAANPTNTTLSERVEETQRKIQALFATGGTRPAPPAPGSTSPQAVVESRVRSEGRARLEQRLARWNLIKSLIPNSRTDATSMDYFRTKLEWLEQQDAGLAAEFRARRFAEFSPGEALGIILEFLEAEYTALEDRGYLTPEGNFSDTDALIEAIQKSRTTYRERLDAFIAPPKPATMSLKEIAEYMASHPEMDRMATYVAEFENRLDIYQEEPERSMSVLLAAAAKALVVGSPKKKDWSTDLNKVFGPAAGMNMDFEVITTAFLKQDGGVMGGDDIARGVIGVETRAIQLWDYIVARIKHKPVYGGISRAVGRRQNGQLYDATSGLIPQRSGETSAAYQQRLAQIEASDGEYSYTATTGRTAEKFTDHLKLVFNDIPKEQLSILLMFFKAFGAKSAAYVDGPLPTGQTRAHGAPIGEKIADESGYLNPFALRLYQATRYNSLMPQRSLFRFAMVDRGVFLKLLEIHQESKIYDGETIYDLFNAWIKVNCGTIPQWVSHTRQLTAPHGDEPPMVDLTDTVFPTVPKMFCSVMQMDHDKSTLLAQLGNGTLSRADFDRRVWRLVTRYQHQGYFDFAKLQSAMSRNGGRGDTVQMLKALRGRKLNYSDTDGETVNLDLGQYLLAAKAVEMMFDIFDHSPPQPGSLNDRTIISRITDWCSGIIGKAKLIPGSHHLLFAPMTCEYIQLLFASYEFAGNQRMVESLFRNIMRDVVLNPKGLPPYFGPEVARLFGGKSVEQFPNTFERRVLGKAPGYHFIGKVPDYMTYRTHANARARYMSKYNSYALRFDSTLSGWARRLSPIGGQQIVSPFISDGVVSKDTSKSSK